MTDFALCYQIGVEIFHWAQRRAARALPPAPRQPDPAAIAKLEHDLGFLPHADDDTEQGCWICHPLSPAAVERMSIGDYYEHREEIFAAAELRDGLKQMSAVSAAYVQEL